SFPKNRRVHSTSPPFGPAPMNANGTPYLGTHDVNFRNSTAYSSGVKFPPQPHDSFPIPQYRTLNGSRSPAAARIPESVVCSAGALQYSTQSSKSRALPDRTFAARYGSAPINLQNRQNSFVPNSFGSYFA